MPTGKVWKSKTTKPSTTKGGNPMLELTVTIATILLIHYFVTSWRRIKANRQRLLVSNQIYPFHTPQSSFPCGFSLHNNCLQVFKTDILTAICIDQNYNM